MIWRADCPVRKAARLNRQCRFTALLHHVTPLLLWQSYNALRKDAAAGVNGVTWQSYEKQLYRGRMHELHREIHAGTAYVSEGCTTLKFQSDKE